VRLIRKLGRFVCRLFAWLPVLWRDEDWDWSTVLEILDFKLRRLQIHLYEHDQHVNSQKYVKQIEEVRCLLDRILADNYVLVAEAVIEPVYGKLRCYFSESSDETDNRGSRVLLLRDKQSFKNYAEIEKYERKIHAKYNRKRESDWKALFRQLERNLRNWWD
jgi:hypothetical protein